MPRGRAGLYRQSGLLHGHVLERPLHLVAVMHSRAPFRHASVLLAILTVPAAARAEGVSPIQLALVDPVQIFDSSTSIHGLRINLIYGYNRDIRGLDLGLVNRNSGSFGGVQLGVVGISHGSFTGWQANFVNYTEAKFVGLQLGAGNLAQGLLGIQWGAVSFVGMDAEGVQIAVVNYANRMSGLQLGLVNICVQLKGLQIGLINLARNGVLPIMPIVNWAF